MLETIANVRNETEAVIPKRTLWERVTIPDTAPSVKLKKDRSLMVLGLAIAAQVGCLFAFVMPYQNALSSGPTIVLKGVSYDPRDALKGDYVSIQFDIGNKVRLADYKPGDQVYLTMVKREPHWRADAASRDYPKHLNSDQVAVRATVLNGKRVPAQVSLGIEKYYVTEGRGADANGELTAEVAVGKDGLPVFRRLLSSGKAY